MVYFTHSKMLCKLFRQQLRKTKLSVAVRNNLEAKIGKRSYYLRLNKFSDWVGYVQQ